MIDDLELRKYGFYVYSLDPARIFPHPNGNVIRSDQLTLDEVAAAAQHYLTGHRYERVVLLPEE